MARKNAKICGVDEKIKFIQSDLFSVFSAEDDFKKKFDIIIANPPYIVHRELKNLPKDVSYEPENALDGGVDGLMFYRKIIEGCRPYLKESGYIAFEFGDEQRQSIDEIICGSKLFKKPIFFADLNGIFRFVIAERICG